jgi:putative MATE family efflux protein
MLISITANMSFNIIDTYYISILGIEQLTAVSFSFPVVMVLLNISIGFAIGINSVLSRLLGAGNNEIVKRSSTLSLIIGFSASILITIIGILTIDPLFELLGATTEHLVYINEYMFYAYIAMGFRMSSIIISGTFRAHGITKIPSYSILLATIINTILDPILIFGFLLIPKLGIMGAGLATLISNLIAFVVEFYIAAYKYHFFVKLQDLGSDLLKPLKNIIKIAAPASFANALNPISLSIGNYFLANQNSEFVAGFGIGNKIQFFLMVPTLALSAAISPIVGQNFGKGKEARVKKALNLSFIFIISYALVQILILTIFGRSLSGLFGVDSAETSNYSTDFLYLISFTLWGYSFVMVVSSMMNAINRPLYSFFLILMRTIIIFVPLYYFLNSLDLERPLIYAMGISNIISGLLAYSFFKKRFSRQYF